MTPGRETLLSIYEVATLARQADEKVSSLMRSGQMGGIWLSARGQEVLGAAAGTVLRRDDYLVTYYRGLPEQLAKGMSLKEIWAEWLGKATGVCAGKGGGIHVVDPDCGVMVNSGIIGAGLPIAAGLALAAKIRGEDRVCVCTFGDGAVSEGSFHEALNLAAVWKLPVVFLCENNGYAETTAFAKASAVPQVRDRAAAYAMPAETVDGDDGPVMYEAMSRAVDRARAGDGPTLLEAMTYRLNGHYNLDAMAYVPEDELAAARAADPVPRLRAWLVESGHASDEDLTAIEKKAAELVEEAWEFASGSPDPGLEALERDVVAVAR